MRENHISQFVEECLEERENATLPLTSARELYEAWCEVAQIAPVSRDALYRALKFKRVTLYGTVRLMDVGMRAGTLTGVPERPVRRPHDVATRPIDGEGSRGLKIKKLSATTGAKGS